jgi:hypothetical protein
MAGSSALLLTCWAKANFRIGSRTAVPAPHETFRYPIQKPPSGKRAVKLSAKSAVG